MADCIFCQIGSGQIPGEVVYQDEAVMAFKDIHPKAPVHVLIIPKKHIPSTADMTKEDLPVVAHMLEAANIVAQKAGIPGAYKLVINTGASAGQVVMHLHIHLLGGKKITAVV
jgi:histidine triad (HIT) family protein